MGDSLSIEFTRSFVSLLGYPPPKGRASRFNAHFKPTNIGCSDDFQITILGYRRSPIEDWKALAQQVDQLEAYQRQLQRLQQQSHTANVTTIMPEPPKMSWERQWVLDHPRRTAIVANLGAWIRNMTDYEIGFEALLRWVGSFPTGKVLSFFRETMPGHPGCQPNVGNISTFNWINPVQEKPFESYGAFSKFFAEALRRNESKTYQWGQFESYNEYSRKRIQQWASSSGNNIEMYWLNVFNSSVLRRDGHVGWNDCSHNYLPGPPDWWVHFFYSALLDLAQEKRQEDYPMSWSYRNQIFGENLDHVKST